MIVKMLMGFYIARLIKRIVLLEDPDIDTHFVFNDWDATQMVDLSKTSLLPFHHISKQRGGSVSEAERYLSMYYLVQEVVETDSTEPWQPEALTTETTRIEAKICEQSDFGSTEDYEKLFSAWAGRYLVCPDLTEEGKLVMQGDRLASKSKNVQFRIDRCDN